MESVISNKTAVFFKRILADNDPYQLSVLDDLKFDDKRFDDKRLDSTFALETCSKQVIQKMK